MSVRGETAIKDAIRDAGLRCTANRVAVFRVLTRAERPLTHREVVDIIVDLDRVTVFRNLVALCDSGLARRVDVGDRVWRYELVSAHTHDDDHDDHEHVHFSCRECGTVTCLDGVEVTVSGLEGGEAAELLAHSEVQLRGVCEDCR